MASAVAIPNEVFNRSFPAMSRCLLIESRHGVRVEVVRALHAALLFSEVVEPSSLSDGLLKLSMEPYDACIVGTSVTKLKAVDFLTEASERTCSKDCAFVMLVKDGAEIADEAVLRVAHQVVSWPGSKRSLTEGIVYAVVRANKNSPWANILKDATHLQFDTEGLHLISAPVGFAAKSNVVTEVREEEFNTSTLERFISGESSALSEIIQGVKTGKYFLESNNLPNYPAQEILEGIVRGIFTGCKQSAKIDAFQEYFECALELWFADLIRYNEELASNSLRNSLLAYVAQLRA